MKRLEPQGLQVRHPRSAAGEKRKGSSRFNFERMAKACRHSKDYLSRLLNSDGAHPAEDQLYNQHLPCARTDERRYLQLLLQQSRTQIPDRRRRAGGRDIERLTRSHELPKLTFPSRLLRHHRISPEYHLDSRTNFSAHFFAVQSTAENPRLIGRSLNLSMESLTVIRAKLERMGIIALEGGRYPTAT